MSIKRVTIVVLTLLIGIPSARTQSRSDHLEPTKSIFDLYDFQLEYYSLIRNQVYDERADNAVVRLLILPSFGPELLMFIDKTDDNQNFSLNIYRPEKSIWYDRYSNDQIDKPVVILKSTRALEKSSANLIIQLFNTALNQVKKPEKEIYGLDGTTYHFYSRQAYSKSGQTWSPKNDSKMKELVDICYELLRSFDNTRIDQPISLNEDLSSRIDRLIERIK